MTDFTDKYSITGGKVEATLETTEAFADMYVPDILDRDERDLIQNRVQEYVKEQRHRIELALRGALWSGYDGLDVNYETGVVDISPASIEPWSYPAPDSANGYLTRRFTWDWADNDEILRLVHDDERMAELSEELQGCHEQNTDT